MDDGEDYWAWGWLQPMPDDVKLWLRPILLGDWSDHRIKLNSDQIKFLRGYVTKLPTAPRKVVASVHAVVVELNRAHSPDPYSVRVFLESVLAFNDTKSKSDGQAVEVADESGKGASVVSSSAWVIRLRHLKRQFLLAEKTSRLKIVLVQSANGQDVNDLQPTADDPLRISIARQDVRLTDGTPAWRFTYEFGKPNDPAKRLMERGDDILKAHGAEILRLFGLRFIDSRKNWAWLLWQLKNVEQPYQGDIEAESTMAGVLSPNDSQQVTAWAFGCEPRPNWYAERTRSFRVDLPHAATASIAAIRAILDRVGSVPHSANKAAGDNGKPTDKANSSPSVVSPTGAEQHPDGPEDPYWLWWKGERHKVGSDRARRTYDLLMFFWRRESATFEELVGHGKPWTEAVQDHAFSNSASNFNNAMPRGFPWRLRTGGRRMFKEKISLKS